jgi:hypothetical protein
MSNANQNFLFLLKMFILMNIVNANRLFCNSVDKSNFKQNKNKLYINIYIHIYKSTKLLLQLYFYFIQNYSINMKM